MRILNNYRWTPVMEHDIESEYTGMQWYSASWSSRTTPTLNSPFAISLVSGGGGQRCFPEKDLSGNLNNLIAVGVSLLAAIPAGMTGTVHLAWFDPNNPKGSTKTPGSNWANTVRDNHGVISFVTSSTLAFTGGVITMFATMKIDPAHAGDNYIVTAHPREGIQVNRNWRLHTDGKTVEYPTAGAYRTLDVNHQTPMLTVWRTLWAELDELKLQPNNIIAAGFPLIDGFVKSELARACIDIKPYSPNTTTWASGPEFLPDEWNKGPKTPKSIAAACRNSPQPSNTFWTIHMIGAFWQEGNSSYGVCYAGANTIFVFNNSITNRVDAWNQANPTHPLYPISPDQAKRRTSLHEIGHALGLDHAANGIMLTGSTVGWETRMQPANLAFTEENISTVWIFHKVFTQNSLQA